MHAPWQWGLFHVAAVTREGPQQTGLGFDLDLLTRWALAIAVVLVPVNVLIGALKVLDHESVLTAVLSYFDTGNELTFPTWFSTLLLAAGGVGAAAASRSVRHPVLRRGFVLLAAVMFYLSLDEATGLHERAIDPIRNSGDLPPFLYFGWVIPASLGVIVVGALLVPFLRRLTRPVQIGFLMAGAVYVVSAIGLELVAGTFMTSYGPGALTDISSMIEETGEMLAAILVARTAFLAIDPGIDAVTTREVFMLDGFGFGR